MYKTVSLFSISLFILTILWSSCSNKRATKTPEQPEEYAAMTAGPPVIIYKTKKDYNSNIPVILSEDKSRIVSYPAKNDIMRGGNFAYPTVLREGYLLDNRGIDEHVAFLDYTYDSYSELESTPSADMLMGHVIDEDPLLAMYRCGTRYDYKNLVDELNSKIASGEFEGCEKLK